MFKIIFRKMDSFEINKIVAAILMVALIVIGIGKFSDIIFHVEKPKTPGYAVEVEQVTTASTTTGNVVEEKIDIAVLMAMGDVANGEKIFKKCAACHSIIKGGKNKIGPALYNVVGRKVGKIQLDLAATNLFNQKYRAFPSMPIIERRVVLKAGFKF